MKKQLIVLSGLAIFLGACSVINPGSINLPGGNAPAAPASGGQTGASALADLYDRLNPGVVTIRAYNAQSGNLGAGFVVDTNGHILTNLHVVLDATTLEVDFPSGIMVRGTIIAQDPDSDLAVIKVDLPASDLTPLPLGDSSAVRVGDQVVAIGSPFRFANSMTMGIVSAKGRTLDSMRDAPGGGAAFFASSELIQTDAAMDSGNSGGPLINMKGEVIGINRAIISSSTSDVVAVNSGVGFAISSNVIRRVLPSLIANGKYDYPYLGVSALPQLLLLTQEDLGLPYGYGVYIISVTSGSPADKAGIHGAQGQAGATGLPTGGDLILKLNGVNVRDFSEMFSYLFFHTVPGDTITATIFRDGKLMEIPVTIGNRP